MKKIILILTVLFLYGTIYGQCPQGNVILDTQQKVDDFIASYPNCTAINGNLIVGKPTFGEGTTTDINNLSGLSKIKSIAGHLHIINNDYITNLTGLDSLTTVLGIKIGDLTYLDGFDYPPISEGNDQLNDLTALQNITSSVNLHIEGNNSLTNLAGLDNIKVNYLYIRNNQYLSICSVVSVCSYLLDNNASICCNANGCNNKTQIMSGCPRSCSQGTITFSTQQQIDDFNQNYINCIDGNIIIEETTPGTITNLNGLSTVDSVGGNIHIKNNSTLSDISGLQNLTTVSGSLFLNNNDALVDFMALSSLDSINGNLEITDNDNLSSLTGLQHIFYGGINNLVIQNNPKLSLCTLGNICIYLDNAGTATISGNASGCESVTSVTNACSNLPSSCLPDGIIFSSQKDINDFAVNYYNCTQIEGFVQIGNFSNSNSDITNLAGLSQITHISDYLRVENNPGLNSLAGLENLERMGSLTIGDIRKDSYYSYPTCLITYANEGNPLMTDFSGLNGLKRIDNNVYIIGNNGLVDFSGLEQLEYIGGSLNVWGNPVLRDFTGLENVKSIGGLGTAIKLEYLRYHPASCHFYYEYVGNRLQSFEGLSSLDTIRGSCSIVANSFTTFSGLENLKAIQGNFHIYNTNMWNFSGLENLNSIGGSLSIGYFDDWNLSETYYGNYALGDITALSNLTYVGGAVSVLENDILTSLSGLDNIDYTSISGLEIKKNDTLDVCNVQSICDYFGNGGTATISNNAVGCNNSTQVKQSCLLPVEVSTPLQAYLQNRAAILTWSTATETNNSGFEIQRSKDGINWEKTGWQAGQGNITTPHTYMYIDENPLSGVSYYRFKQVDFDGNFTYSNIASLEYTRPYANIYPNPVKDKLYINTHEPIDDLLIFDTTGRQINTRLADNTIDVSLFPKGLYTIKIIIGQQYFCEKIVVE